MDAAPAGSAISGHIVASAAAYKGLEDFSQFCELKTGLH